MRLLWVLLVALVGAIVPAPPASAVGWQCAGAFAASACAGEFDNYGGCPNEWDFQSSFTGAQVSTIAGGATVGGSRSCSHICLPFFGCFRGESSGIRFQANVAPPFAPSALVWGGWTVSGSGCDTFVAVSAPGLFRMQSLGCPAGPPPDLPWGHVLP